MSHSHTSTQKKRVKYHLQANTKSILELTFLHLFLIFNGTLIQPLSSKNARFHLELGRNLTKIFKKCPLSFVGIQKKL